MSEETKISIGSIEKTILDKGIEVILENFLKRAAKSWNKLFKSNQFIQENNDIEDKLLKHFNYLINWSSEIEFIGLGKPKLIDNSTIPLNLSFNIRRFTKASKQSELLSEEDILTSDKNYIILGDPGSGKTTTLKRILQKNFFSLPVTELYIAPLLIRLRKIPDGKSLWTYIADELGIRYYPEERKYISIEKKIKITVKKDKDGRVVKIEKPYDKKVTKKRIEYFIKEQKLELVLKQLLDENRILIILDGLDEISTNLNISIQEQIEDLGLNLRQSKIILTCRPGYIERNFENFYKCEICELNEPQIRQISKLWLKDYSVFLDELKTRPFYELANRPLFLCFLILIYKEENSIPLNSKEIYPIIIDLFLINWDKDRAIYRDSKYSNFNNNRKKEFLEHLAFNLTYKIKRKIFSSKDLQNAYLLINQRFRLPSEEAKLVANEIENHTGLVVSAFYDKFEFSHLALQEYLCSCIIGKSPISGLISTYLTEFPSAVALAIAHAPNSSEWFANIIFLHFKETHFEDLTLAKKLIDRILIEHPYFEECAEFGIAIMALCKKGDCANEDFLNTIYKLYYYENVKSSIIKALSKYRVTGKTEHKIALRSSYFYYTGENAAQQNLIEVVNLPMKIAKELSKEGYINSLEKY